MSSPRSRQHVVASAEQLFGPLVEQALVGIYLIQDNRFAYVNPKLAELFGYTLEEFGGLSVADVVAEEDRPLVAANLHVRVEGYLDTLQYTFRGRRKDGSRIPVEVRGTRITFQGRPAVCGTLLDLTEQVTAKAALRESRRRLSTLVSNLPGMVYRCRHDRDWTMEYVSETCRELTGYAPTDLLGKRISYGRQVIHPEDRAHVWRTVQDTLAARQPFALEYRVRTASGELKWVWERGRGVFSQDGTLLALEGFITDVTERKRLEQQFQQSQKMEAFGQLAAGIAHDFNNLLTAINGHSELLLEGLSPDAPTRQQLEQIQYAGEHAATLTRQLLAFSRKQVLAPKVLDLNEILGNVEKLLKRLIGEDVSLVIQRGAELWPVRADPGQLEQVILNLAVNARDAMRQGGRLEIETANVPAGAVSCTSTGEQLTGPCVLLAVKDTGCGMDADTRRRIFEPFFTTKEVGKGTGLGLATVHGIVVQSGGGIDVLSEVGRGTTFRVYLPRVTESPQKTSEEATRSAQTHASETILLVEDEAVVRDLARAVLSARGYTILEASHGSQALQVAREFGAPIHLLLTDTVMPGMSGPELAVQLRTVQPEIKVLYMSGYLDRALTEHGIHESAIYFLQKPFKTQVLLRKVREVLSEPSARDRADPG